MPFLPTHKPGALQIGLVNNMPDAALARTEQQFLDVLAAAVPDRAINLHMFHIPGVPRGELGRSHLSSHRYRDATDLRLAGLDGLIVTGTEPRQPNLRQEPYWLAFARMFDWIAERGPSTVFSCLAAHAAVLHYDGVERERLATKRFGLFAHSVVGPHSLTQHLPETFSVSHSRWNEVNATALSMRGYQILTESHDAGVDLFWRNARKPMFFFQGHPEYDSRTLFREYRRDVLRFLMGEHETYPQMPQNYFSTGESAQLSEFQDRALEKRNTALMPSFPVASPEIVASGEEPPAPAIYRAWLSQIAEPFVERRKVPRIAGARR